MPLSFSLCDHSSYNKSNQQPQEVNSVKKAFISLTLMATLVGSAASSVLAAANAEQSVGLKTVIDGQASDVAPFLWNGHVMLPLRAVFAKLGVQNDGQHIIWNEADRSVTIQVDATKIYVKVGSTDASVNDQPVALEAAPFIKENSGRTYIPARFIEQSLGKKVAVDDTAKSVFISTTNKEKAVAVLKSLGSGNPQAIEKWISSDTYIQHNLAFSSGRETILNFVKQYKPNPEAAKASATATGVRVISDGDYVAVQSSVSFFKTMVVFDIFRFDNGKIVEHWDNVQEQTGLNPSGHTMIDGATKITDLDKTEANKALIKSYVQDVLIGRNSDKLTSYIDGENYTEHNPAMGDGLSGVSNGLAVMSNPSFKYDKVHMVIGEGNFVLVMSEGSLAGKPTAFYDLFRIAGGKIVEHWDVLETIPPKSEWKNTNGKF